MNEEELITDRNGKALKAGDFIYYHNNKSLPAGPYRYEGFRYVSHIFSVPGMDFITSDIRSSEIEILPWKRWKNSAARTKEVLDYWEKNRSAAA